MHENGSTSNSLIKNLSGLFVAKFRIFWMLHKRLVIIVASVFAVLLILLTVLFYSMPTVGVSNTQYVNLDTTVRIKSDQRVQLKDGNVSVEVVHFTNDTCPNGQVCFGKSIQAVEYMLKVGNDKFAVGSSNPKNSSGYEIKTVSSDYKTYAEIKIVKTTP